MVDLIICTCSFQELTPIIINVTDELITASYGLKQLFSERVQLNFDGASRSFTGKELMELLKNSTSTYPLLQKYIYECTCIHVHVDLFGS